MASPAGRSQRRGTLRGLGEAALKALGFFVILEPVWMLLPFAGFLYGSVLQIERLNQSASTSWLTHFVFPVLTLGPVGPALVGLGLGLFLAGAAQIYGAKLRGSGLVTGGLYRFVRHPQYVALTLLGLGVLLAWGRALMWLAFFLMMFLYYWLARSEERACLRVFGEAYERYRERTSFVIPGDRRLRPLGERLGRLGLPAAVRVPLALACTLGACFGLMWGIDAAKRATQRVPYLTVRVEWGPAAAAPARAALAGGAAAGVPYVQAGRLVVARGPWRGAQASGFAERLARRLRESRSLAPFLAFLDEAEGDWLFAFCGAPDGPPEGGKGAPGLRAGGGPGGRGPAPDPGGPDRVRLVLMRCSLAAGAGPADALADRSRRTIRQGCIALANPGAEEGAELVEADGAARGPGFPGERLWDFFLAQFAREAAGGAAAPGGAGVTEPGRFAGATLVLVQAPILKARLELSRTLLLQPQSGPPPFALELRERLAASARLRAHLRQSGAGGDVVAVAFPRPGPNWYREHHHAPQVSVFVFLARVAGEGGVEALFRPAGRELLGAFVAEMDLAVAAPADCVTQITPIGRRRDLEERWRFFLSGVGR